jgi:HEAT repeat protein
VQDVVKGFLGSLRGRLAIADIARILDADSDKNERARAARVLEQLGDRAAVPALMAALTDTDPFVRMMAAQALRGLGDLRAVAALETLLAREQNERVIRVARSVLGVLQGRLAQR